MGFTEVYDYGPGKAGWGAAGLPLEESGPKVARLGDLARTDVPTCELAERVGDAAGRVKPDWTTCIVINEEKVVLGRLYRKELERDPASSVEDAMRPGPSTFRPNVLAAEMAGYMHDHGLETAPVTTSDGRLIGLVLIEDVERAVEADDSPLM